MQINVKPYIITPRQTDSLASRPGNDDGANGSGQGVLLYWYKGGRGHLKSSDCANLWAVNLLLHHVELVLLTEDTPNDGGYFNYHIKGNCE